MKATNSYRTRDFWLCYPDKWRASNQNFYKSYKTLNLIYQMLPFIFSRYISPIGNKVPDREFYWSANYEFYSRFGIWNCKSVWSADRFVRKLILLGKNESSLEKKAASLKDFFSSKSKSSKKREVYKTKVARQNSAIKCYHEFHVRSHRFRFTNVNIGGSFSVTKNSNLIVALFKIKGTILRWEKLMNGKKFLL